MKKRTKKSKPTKAKRQELVIKVQSVAPVTPTVRDLSEPMRKGKKLTIPKTWVSESQLTKILQITPRHHVYQRPGKGGGKFDYVTTSYVTKALNYIFGWNWDFDILEHGIEGGQVWVKGKLTVRGVDSDQVIVKTQFGRNDIKFRKGAKDMLDLGNDMKGAASDALKKCASMLGIASDIYGKADYNQEAGKDPVDNRPIVQEAKTEEMKEGQIIGPDGKPTYVCSECGDPISDQVADYSLKRFNKRLCREHQPVKK